MIDILMSVSPKSRERESAMKKFYQYYVAMAPESKIKVNKIHHFLKIDMTEVYFLTEDEYENWCKGRTYMFKGEIYRSGYPINHEIAKAEEVRIPLCKGLQADMVIIDEFLTKEESDGNSSS